LLEDYIGLLKDLMDFPTDLVGFLKDCMDFLKDLITLGCLQDLIDFLRIV